MTRFMILQLTGIFCAYLLVTVGLPAYVFGRKLAGRRLPEKFMFYFIIGNFYIMNLVFLLQLLKISYTPTLVIGTIVPAVWARAVLDGTSLKAQFSVCAKELKKLIGGQLGVKSAVYKVGGAVRRQLARLCRGIGWLMVHRTLDCILVALVLAALFWIYGTNVLQQYGYKASDIPVHNYWINAMGQNNIFVAGVYPHGFHCVIYYLHAAFGFDTYLLLVLFAFVENVMVHLMLLCFLRLCCKARYTAYAGVIVYILGGIFSVNTYSRFYSALPQEFGMIFIFPAVYCGFAFFRVRKKELKEAQEDSSVQKKQTKMEFVRSVIHRSSFPYLAVFAMSFAMTLAVHFYGTMVAGLFCVAMAVGYASLFFRKKYFWNVVITCAISVVLAVFPMVWAYIGGTPLQGSLGWGMNVIKGSSVSTGSTNASSGSQSSNVKPGQEDEDPGPVGRVVKKIWSYWEAIHRSLNSAVLRMPDAGQVYWFMYSFWALIFLGVVFLLLRRYCYGAMLISTGVYMLLLCVMMAYRTFGIPAIMDNNRGSIYFAYSLPVMISFLIDAVLYLVSLPIKNKGGRYIINAVSFACVFCAVGLLWRIDKLKEPRNTYGQEMNEAVTCLTNIIRSEEDFTWTICSANDETQMGFDHGFHYETIVFLEEMEYLKESTMVRIPTPVVYFFIEKVPLDYYASYAGSGQSVSEEGASNELPENKGIGMYKGEKRWIVMSRMYYWAQQFQKMNPNEVEVYLETDNFICYRVQQNMYRLFNFAIDYGYNSYGTDDGDESDLEEIMAAIE